MSLNPNIEIRGSRDLTDIERVVSHPSWKMPPGVYDWLPLAIAEVATAKISDGPKAGQYKYSARARQKAAALILKLNEQNLKAAPPAQTVNVHVAADVETAMERVKALDPEQLAALASAHGVLKGLVAGDSGHN